MWLVCGQYVVDMWSIKVVGMWLVKVVSKSSQYVVGNAVVGLKW